MKKLTAIFLIVLILQSVLISCESSKVVSTDSGASNESFSESTVYSEESKAESAEECEHNWERVANVNESTACDKCSKCGETRMYTAPESLPVSYTFSGPFGISVNIADGDIIESSDNMILDILNYGLWEREMPAREYDYVFIFSEAELLYDSVNGIFLHSEDNRFLELDYEDVVKVKRHILMLFPNTNLPQLDMETLISLADAHGDDLTWKHFAAYQYEDVGSGLYVFRYSINEDYYLLIGGGDLNSSPMYISLVSEHDRDKSIEVRSESINDFLNSNDN